MDPLDIMMNKNQVIPYFLPIISADKQQIIGYEVQAYWVDGDEKINLNWFFEDRDIPSDYLLELEDDLQEKAISLYTKEKQSSVLCFHYSANLLRKNAGEELLARLEAIDSLGIPLHRIIVIIGCQHTLEELLEVKHTMVYMQSLGVQIAIDADSSTPNQFELFTQLRPNVIRVNCRFLEENVLPGMYKDVHQPLSQLARKIGATLLFEGVETFKQLNYAWRSGGRYYQGSYLRHGEETFIDENECKNKLTKDMNHFIHFERQKMEAQFQLSNALTTTIKQAMKTIESSQEYDEVILKVASMLDEFTFRVYICNANGFQESANAEKNEEGKWELHKEGRAKNWSWRPYFLENIVRMNVEKKGILSDLYIDIERDEQIRTYSYPLTNTLYVFIDIPYAYLFEQDGLL
ncbi:EAL domain-containing protein [Shouchella patagoniensis]|uniref:EAL domain-containing protein n=1 Tax=Shouchella patagoniensis TaxID=228576 RepID=UPI00099573E9|nr:EAL-associated domain-containing protein [Shouchella patagoniensis]